MTWSTESLKRSIHLTGQLSQLYERLQADMQVTSEEILRATQQLEELGELADVPGAMQMHQKYRSLLYPFLQSYGVASYEAPPAWDQGAAMRYAFDLFQQSQFKSQVVDYVHHLYQVVQRLREGEQVSPNEIESIVSQLDEMGDAVRQVATEYPQLPEQFERGVQRLRTELSEMGDELMTSATDHASQGDFERATMLSEESYAYYLAAEDTNGRGLALFHKAHALQSLGKHDAATLAYRQGRVCFQESGERDRECQLLYAWGRFYLEQERSEEARELFTQGLQLAEDEGVSDQQAEGHRLLGDAWVNQGQFSHAILSYQKAIEVAQLAGDRTEQRQVWSSLGRLHVSMQLATDAVHAYEQALSLADGGTDQTERALILLNLTLAHQAQNQTTAARDRWEQALEATQGLDNAELQEFLRLVQPER